MLIIYTSYRQCIISLSLNQAKLFTSNLHLIWSEFLSPDLKGFSLYECLGVVDIDSIHPVIPTGNNAHNNSSNANNKVADQGEGEEGENVPKPKVESARKEKSVLQGKLTKLAIQIGYGGML